MTACQNPKYHGVEDLVEAHPRGIEDAVNASTEAEAFVRDALRLLNAYEYELERPR